MASQAGGASEEEAAVDGEDGAAVDGEEGAAADMEEAAVDMEEEVCQADLKKRFDYLINLICQVEGEDSEEAWAAVVEEEEVGEEEKTR